MSYMINEGTAEDLLKKWKKGAKCDKILNMTAEEVTEFALKNELDVREVRVGGYGTSNLFGWRLYETHLDTDGETRVPDELYYVVRRV